MGDFQDIIKLLPSEVSVRHGGVYGCKKLISLYCGFQEIPWQGRLDPQGSNWQHGWLPMHHNVHPELSLGINGATYSQREKTFFFVARKDQADYLSQTGYRHVHAIGLPFLYTEEPSVSRIPGSLLVLPVHSTQSTHHNRQSKQYAEFIKSISHHFSRICTSIHPSDLIKGYWVNEFQAQGLSFVSGANSKDSNALDRMRLLFSMFEYVTTNGFGSHLAYAAFCGAKVSIAGPFEENKVQDLAETPFIKNCPEVAELLYELTNHESIKKHFPSFFIDPWDATQKIEWAKEQLGFYNLQSPSITRKLLGWDLKNRLMQSLDARFPGILGKGK